MKRHEVILCRRRYLKAAAPVGLSAASLYVALPLLMMRLELGRQSWPGGLWTTANVIVFGLLLAALLFVARYESRAAKRHGYACTACGRAFVGKLESLLEAGKCPHCGAQILDDESIGGAKP